MNKIYKSVWNAITRTFTAVSENQKSYGKGSKSIILGLPIFLLSLSGQVMSETLADAFTREVIFGDQTSAKTAHLNEAVTSSNPLIIKFEFDRKEESKEFSSTEGSESIAQSEGFFQNLVVVSGLNSDQIDASEISIEESGDNLVEQTINQNGIKAIATYAIGKLAYDGLLKNRNMLDPDLLDQVTENGISLYSEGFNPAISTLSFLTMLSIEKAQEAPFKITAQAPESTFYAKVTGGGDLLYTGTSNSNVLNISSLEFPADDPVGSNHMDYTGATYVDNLHIVLNRDDSLGHSAKLVATDNAIVEANVALDVTHDDGGKEIYLINGMEFDNSKLIAHHLVNSQGDGVFQNKSELSISTTESLKFKNLTIDKTSLMSGEGVNVNVGETLTVLTSNENLTGAFVAKDAVLGDVEALGSADLTLSDSLTFQDASGTKSFGTAISVDGTNKLSINVVDSKVEYDESLTLSPSKTTIKGDSNLIVHNLDQLGGNINFVNGDKEDENTHSLLTFDMQQGGNPWDIDNLAIQNSRSDAQAIVIASGSGFSISGNTLKDFNGWLRLSNMEYSLDAETAKRFSTAQSGNTLGLSIGHNATLKITDHMEIGTFGWANDGTGGVLDVTGHKHSQDDYIQKEILHVTNLYLDGTGSIRIDPTQYIQNTGPDTGRSVLDYDNGDNSNRYTIIKADNIIGDDNLKLEVVSGTNSSDVIESMDSTELFNLNTGVKTADATWGYTAGKDKAAGEVYITYGLQKLNLVGSDNPKASLIIDLTNAEDNTLSATVGGEGIIDVISRKEDKKEVVFEGHNTFKGTVNVSDGIKLTSYTDALSGDSENLGQVNLNLTDGASVVISTRAGAGIATQYLKSLRSVDTTSVVEIKNLTELALTGTGSQFNGKLSGQGILNVLGGELSTNVGTLNAFEGELQANDGGKLAIGVSTDEVLTHNIEMDETSWLVKDGSGNLGFDIKETVTRTGSKLNVRVNDGSVTLNSQTPMGSISVAEGKSVNLDGLVEVTNLSGSGNLAMDIEFGSDANKGELGQVGDGLRVAETASGNFALMVSPRDLQKGAVESIRVMEVEGDATQFELALANGLTAVQSGAYDYKLIRTDDGTGADFDLTSVAGASDQRNTTAAAGAYIGIAYAAQLFDLSLHDRVGNRDWINPVTGEKQSTSLWMHHTMSHERFRDSTSQLRMRTTSNTTMLGGDFVQFTTGNTGLAYAGLMGGYGTMDTKTRSKMTNLHSKAETDAWGVGAYAGWKADSDGQTGPYVDGWLMFTHASSDVTGVDRNTEDVKGEGLSASIEAGWGFKVGSVQTDNGKIANFTVEPHASVTWFGMEYDEIHNEAQDVKFEGTNNIRTRLGARAIVTEEGNKDFNAFVEANWVHNTQEYGATISGLTVDQAGSRNMGEARIGVDWRVTDSLSVWGRVGASYGSDAYSEREGSIGVRYQF